MKHLGRQIIQTFEDETGQSLENVPAVPDCQEISDHHEAKETMKTYLEGVIDHAEKKNFQCPGACPRPGYVDICRIREF